MVWSMRPIGVAALALICTGVVTGCGGGGGSGGSSTASATGAGQSVSAPRALIQAQSGASAGDGNAALEASVGSTVILTSASTAGAGSSIASYHWSLTAEPEGSQVALTNASAPTENFVPDMAGTYTLQLQVTDTQGQTASQSVSIAAISTPPVSVITAKVQFNDSSVTQPTMNVTLGAAISLDASQAATFSEDPVAISFTLLQTPQTSTAALATNGTTAHFTPDVAGKYQVRVRGTHASGDYVDALYVFNAQIPPAAVLVAQTNSPLGAQNGSLTTYTNYSVVLDSSASTAASGDSLVRSWTLASRPNASFTGLSSASATSVSFVPDVPGVYVVTLTTTDQQTAAVATYTETVTVANGPTAAVTGSSAPISQVAAPSLVSSTGVLVKLHGGGSYDVTGGALTYSWAFTQVPALSHAELSANNTADVTFTPDQSGVYKVALTVTNGGGLSSTQTAMINVGGYAPTAAIDMPQSSVVLGGSATLSASASYDPNLLPLTYEWSLDAKPAGSNATLGSSANAVVTFRPDIVGTYSLSVTVNNGVVSSVATATVTVFGPTSGTVPLAYLPLMSAYSSASGKAVIVSTNPNALHVVDPAAGTDVSVPLPAGAKSIAMSPNGTLAAVLHEGTASLIDVTHASLLHSSGTNGSQTTVMLSNAGVLYLLGQTDGQWVTPGINLINGYTGNVLSSGASFGEAYGSMTGIYSDLTDKLFVVSSGLSPTQVYDINLDGYGNVTGSGQSPYWGDYAMYGPFWLSGDQSLLFTAAGTYFSTSDLHYIGTFGVRVISMSHSSVLQEAVVLPAAADSYTYPPTVTYPSSYQRFTGSLLFPAGNTPLPVIAGQQSYGIAIYHAASGAHVILVQTGTSQQNAAGVSYFLLQR